MSDRQPTEHELKLKLIAKVMGWKFLDSLPEGLAPPGLCVYLPADEDLLVTTEDDYYIFDPLHDERDLARLVEAMQAAGYRIARIYLETGEVVVEIREASDPLNMIGGPHKGHDLAATFWAIVEALVAEAKDG